ncbi:FAD-binding oxidoreductase [Atribacter laminatus]|uniref:Putative FAD-linked oxidoreductase n=1 Tax=Atribacter laminatus TaxID=2847778 RepID=A0A7T1AKL1_ATRLM|nr:FAD-binding oxidoreductase [Atribacter laminatus]QPM67642.1 putative FAD-linked oxidoreductase [Atribacter laminatus]
MAYKKISENDITFLKKTTAPERVYTNQDINDDFTHDEMMEYGKFSPEAVIEVINSHEISLIMRYAYEKNIPVTPRGSGTGLCGGSVALYGGILISLAKMNQILEIDETNLTVTVEPGVLLMDLVKALAGKELFYPPDPGEKTATIGGNVMTNAGGMRAVKYGVTRDYVRGMDIVLPDGEMIKVGGKIAKNSSGYSLKDLFIGSEGTLGIATKITLKLLPLPKKTISLLAPFQSLNDCLNIIPILFKAKIIPTAIELMQKEIIEATEKYLGKFFPDKSADSYLLLSFDGNAIGEVENSSDQAAQVLLNEKAIDVFIADTEERLDAIWTARGAFLEAIKTSTSQIDECDVVVPLDQMREFINYVDRLDDKEKIRIVNFGHAGDGNIHIYLCKDSLSNDEWQIKKDKVMQKMYKKALELGGQVSGEHGIGHAKRAFLAESLGNRSMELNKSIKKVFDPKNILNPGKVCY